MKEIPLTQGKVALVDDEDFEFLSQWKWRVTAAGYAARSIKHGQGRETLILMHRVILATPSGMETDHWNKNRLDNRKANLRAATASDNQGNRKVQVNNTSGYKGVDFNTRIRRWRVRIKRNGRRVCVGHFKSLEEAAVAYNDAAKQRFGEFAMLNPIPEREGQ